jgi:hypothetical protein
MHNGTETVLLYDLQISGTVITAGNTLLLSSQTYTPSASLGPDGGNTCDLTTYTLPTYATLMTNLADTPGYIQITNIEYGYTLGTTPLPSPRFDVLPN